MFSISAPRGASGDRQLNWSRFEANDLETNTLLELERARGQEHGIKAENTGRHVKYCSATSG